MEVFFLSLFSVFREEACGSSWIPHNDGDYNETHERVGTRAGKGEKFPRYREYSAGWGCWLLWSLTL